MAQKKETPTDIAFEELQGIVYNKGLSSASKLQRAMKLAEAYEGGPTTFVRAIKSRQFPLFFIPICAGEPLIVRYFLENGADAKVTRVEGSGDEKGVYGTLHELVRGLGRITDPSLGQMQTRPVIGKMLADAGADPNLRNSLSETPLMQSLREFGYGSLVRFKPKTPTKKLDGIFGYKSLAEAGAKCDIERLTPKEAVIDRDSSVAHMWFNFFHLQIKGFDPNQTTLTRSSSPSQANYQQLLERTEDEHLREYADEHASFDERDKRNGGIREKAILKIVEHTSIATREEIVRKDPKAKWILPAAMQKAMGR